MWLLNSNSLLVFNNLSCQKHAVLCRWLLRKFNSIYLGVCLDSAFFDRLQSAGRDRKLLIALMGSIDVDKRAVKSELSRLSSEPDPELSRGRARQTKIRKLRDRLSFLTEQRQLVQNKLSQINSDKKALNRATSNTSPVFAQAFLAAAERLLPEEQFNELETLAAEILQTK